MVWLKLLLTIGIAATTSFAVSSPVHSALNECTFEHASAGLCEPPEADGAVNGGGVDVTAGIDSGSNGSGNHSSDADSSGSGSDAPASDTPTVTGPDAIDRDGYEVNCIPNSPCDPNFIVSIRDLVNFTPATASTGMEPNGWMVVGLPANFIADASTHIRSGMLLGFAAEVRFTPTGYSWTFGDGASARVASGGATWAAQGLPEFSDTSTSHRYAASGTFVITSTVNYTAEYRFAGRQWHGIAGSVAATAAPFTAVAGQTKTALVNDDCQAESAGPGC